MASVTPHIRKLPNPGDCLIVVADLPGLAADRAWRAWTDGAELARWWAPESQMDIRVGGSYALSWPRMGWVLRGAYGEVQPGHRLAFTWQWDHEPSLPEREVTVDFAPIDGGTGTRLTITHGPYGSGEAEAADRQSHLEGWTHFLGQLGALGTS